MQADFYFIHFTQTWEGLKQACRGQCGHAGAAHMHTAPLYGAFIVIKGTNKKTINLVLSFAAQEYFSFGGGGGLLMAVKVADPWIRQTMPSFESFELCIGFRYLEIKAETIIFLCIFIF